MCADAPDTSGINEAARNNAALGREALDWYKQAYADSAPDRRRASDAAYQQSQTQNELSRFSLGQAQKESARYDATFKPIEDSIAADAMAYDTPERREAAARQAGADVEIALDGARDASRRSLERRGVMPGSGASLALEQSMDLAGAKAKAGAANSARQRVETVGAARKADAAALGRGVISNQTTQTQMGLQAGNSGVQNAMVPVSVAQQGANLGGAGFSTAIGANNSAGALYGQAANIQSSANNNGLWGALGQVGGAFLASDENIKTDIKPVSGDAAMQAARKMPVKRWKYRADSPAADGGIEHTGPMAQDVHAALGESVAPGGKAVDVISLAGTALAAVQEVDRRLISLERRQKRAG